MQSVLITHDKLKFLLNTAECQLFLGAIKNNDKAFVLQRYDNAVIPLHITPTLIPFEIWYAQENERLALTHHRLCKKCMSIMHIEDKCACWESGKGEEKNAFVAKLPEQVKKTLAKIAETKAFREVYDSTPTRPKRLITGSDDTGDYYLGDTGEKMYQ